MPDGPLNESEYVSGCSCLEESDSKTIWIGCGREGDL